MPELAAVAQSGVPASEQLARAEVRVLGFGVAVSYNPSFLGF